MSDIQSELKMGNMRSDRFLTYLRTTNMVRPFDYLSIPLLDIYTSLPHCNTHNT
jgi:hypothetical protein